MPDVEYLAESVDYLVEGNGVDWCVLEARTVRGRYATREEAVRQAARAVRQSKEAGTYARILVSLSAKAASR
jgi:hypothetical protein